MNRTQAHRGFTLLEILLVTGLLAIVMAIEYLVSNRFYPAATGGERAS